MKAYKVVEIVVEDERTKYFSAIVPPEVYDEKSNRHYDNPYFKEYIIDEPTVEVPGSFGIMCLDSSNKALALAETMQYGIWRYNYAIFEGEGIGQKHIEMIYPMQYNENNFSKFYEQKRKPNIPVTEGTVCFEQFIPRTIVKCYKGEF